MQHSPQKYHNNTGSQTSAGKQLLSSTTYSSSYTLHSSLPMSPPITTKLQASSQSPSSQHGHLSQPYTYMIMGVPPTNPISSRKPSSPTKPSPTSSHYSTISVGQWEEGTSCKPHLPSHPYPTHSSPSNSSWSYTTMPSCPLYPTILKLL